MLSRQLAAQAPAWLRAAGARAAGTAVTSKAVAAAPSTAVASSEDGITTTTPGQAFVGDLRSTSALCVGDGIFDHTSKWLQVGGGRGRGGGGGWRGARPAPALVSCLQCWCSLRCLCDSFFSCCYSRCLLLLL